MSRFKITYSDGRIEYLEDVTAIDTADSPEVEAQREEFRNETKETGETP